MTAPTPDAPPVPTPDDSPAPTPEPNDAPAPGAPEFKAITSQEEFDKIFGARFAKEKAKYADYDTVAEKAAKFDEQENAKRDELERVTEELTQLREERARNQAEKLRNSVAKEAGIPEAWASRLRGETQEELEADAAELAATLAPTPTEPPPRVPSAQPAPSGGGLPPKEDTAGFDPAAIAAKLAGRF